MSAQICQACGAQLLEGTRFCTKCGKEVTARVCRACGAQLTEGTRFCPNCGKETAARVCQACGAQLTEGTRFCPSCGKEAVLSTPPGKQPGYPVPPAKRSTLLHPSLGLRLVSGFVAIAIILLLWLGLPLIKKGISDNNDTSSTTTTQTTTQGKNDTSTTTTTKTTTQDTTTTTTSANAPWPDVPLYTGARPAEGDWASSMGSLTSAIPGMQTEWHFYQIGGNDLTSAISFYKSKLPQTGWQHLTDASDPSSGAATAVFMKGSEMLMVITMKDPSSSTGCLLGLCRGKM